MTEERDAYLHEALRHAPDAQVQPPPELSALILREARAKLRAAAAPERPARNPFAVLWGWLARPSFAAGFAGVMAATLVGLMWWDRPMDEALPRGPTPAAAPVAAPAAPTSTPTPPLAATSPAAPPAPLTKAARPAPEQARVAARKPAPAVDKAEAALSQAPAEAKQSAAPAAEAATAGVTAGAVQAARETAPVTSMALAPAADAVAAPAGMAAAKEKRADEPRRLQGGLSTDALRANVAPKVALGESRARQEAEAHTSIASLRAAIAAEPARWAWQRGGETQAMNDAVYAWLAQLDSAAGSAWQARAARETAAPLGRELRLLRDGRVLHSLRLTERGVLWEREQTAWQVALPPDTLAALQAALDAAAP